MLVIRVEMRCKALRLTPVSAVHVVWLWPQAAQINVRCYVRDWAQSGGVSNETNPSFLTQGGRNAVFVLNSGHEKADALTVIRTVHRFHDPESGYVLHLRP